MSLGLTASIIFLFSTLPCVLGWIRRLIGRPRPSGDKRLRDLRQGGGRPLGGDATQTERHEVGGLRRLLGSGIRGTRRGLHGEDGLVVLKQAADLLMKTCPHKLDIKSVNPAVQYIFWGSFCKPACMFTLCNRFGSNT